MSDQNGASSSSTGKTYSESDLEKERAHTQHFKQIAEEAAAKLKEFEGVDVKALRAKAAEAEALKNQAALGDPKKFEERVNQIKSETEQQLRSDYGKKITDLESDNKRKDAELKRFRVTNVGLQKAATHNFIPEAMNFVERAIEENCDWDGEKIVVKNKDGKVIYSKKDPQAPMSVDEFLEDFASSNPFFVASKARSGTDTGSTGTKAGANPPKQVKLPPTGFEAWDQMSQQKWFQENPEGGREYMRTRGFRV